MLTRVFWPSRPRVFGGSHGALDHPFEDFEQLRRGVLRLLDAARETGYTEPGAGVYPPLNVSQDDNNFYVRALVPGVKASDIAISALRNRLSISGRRDIPGEKERVSYHRRERAENVFSRAITFPSEIVADRVEARYADGVLALTLPKAEETKPRQIVVKS